MFGFLKKKLQDAVSKFTKKAEEEVVEEKVEDATAIEAAKQAEEKLLREEAAKKVEVIPETRAEKEQHERERTAAKKEPPRKEPPKKAKEERKAEQEEKTVLKKEEPRKKEEKTVKEKKEPEKKELPKRQVSSDHVAITYFVHGTTTDNERKRSSGHGDVELSSLGVQQSKELVKQLTHQFDVIYTSDLKRAVRSAELCWGEGANIKHDSRLREADYGDLTQHPEKELEAYAKQHDIITEGYPNGESLLDVEERMRSLLNEIHERHRGQNVAIVAHKATQFAMEVLLEGKSWEEAIKDDWRPKKQWQPGWEFTLSEHLKAPEEKPLVEEKPKAEEPAPKKGFLKKLFQKEEKKPTPIPEKIPEETKPAQPKAEAEPTSRKEAEAASQKPESIPAKPEAVVEEAVEQPKKGLFGKLKETFTKKTLSEEKFEELFWDLEMAMLENNVAVEVIEKIKADLKEDLTTGKISRLGIEDQILLSLKTSIEEILSIPSFDLVKRIKEEPKRPFVIAFIGVNGSGKTTTLAKVANLFQEEGFGVVIAASDTFRAAAIDQLKEHADKLSIKLVSQGYGADPAAVAFDAIEHAKAKEQEIVMIDTAGRLHSNTNLMAELQKVVRVAKPDLKIFIGESTTGNDCVEQAKEFDRLVGIDAIILSKADVDEKGGAALSVSYVTGKPILYIGVGQSYGDLKRFDKGLIIKSLGL